MIFGGNPNGGLKVLRDRIWEQSEQYWYNTGSTDGKLILGSPFYKVVKLFMDYERLKGNAFMGQDLIPETRKFQTPFGACDLEEDKEDGGRITILKEEK